MKIYVLNYYTLGEQGGVVFVHTDKELVVREAIERSSKERYTYRMETWKNGKMIGWWRFFNKGIEFTSDIRRAVEK